MGFKVKKLRKVVFQAPKIVKKVAQNKMVQTAGRAYLAVQTGGASEMALRGLQTMRSSGAGQAVSEAYNEVKAQNQISAPLTQSLNSTTAQAESVVSTPKNQERQESFSERVSNSFSGDEKGHGGKSKKMIFAVVGGAVLLFFFLKRKK